MPITEDEVIWAYRLFCLREPESADVIRAQAAAYAKVTDLTRKFIDTIEFRSFYGHPKDYSIPAFLIPDALDGIISIKEPSLAAPTSQVCTYGQTQESFYSDFCKIIGEDPTILHRKFWEWAYIARALEVEGVLREDSRGLVYAVGTEPLPSIFAAKGCQILASDGPAEVGQQWSGSKEFSDSIESLIYPSICDPKKFRDLVSFCEIDMLKLPDDIKGFDFLWSSCSLEHLGGIEPGSKFVKDSLQSLKSGGVAIHTTEFNLTSNDNTVDSFPTCLFRKQDIEKLVADLSADGHLVREVNFWPGKGQLDAYIDYPPHAPPHLKLALYQYVSTSIGLIVIKDGA